MRTLLCFGDSNTYGSTPGRGERVPRDVRWPGRLQSVLGDEWHVDDMADRYSLSVPEKSAVLPARFRAVAEDHGVELLHPSTVTRYSDVDGIHVDEVGRAAVSDVVARAAA